MSNPTSESISLSADLRESVADYRNPATTSSEREIIVAFWAKHGIKNQFMAMITAAELDHTPPPVHPDR